MKVVIYGDGLFSSDMAWGFRELGHEVQLVFPRIADELNIILFLFSPDLLITLGSPAYYNTTILDFIGKRSQSEMKYVHWDTDGITWRDIEMNLVNRAKPDIVFTVCPEMLELLHEKGIPSELLFYAYCPLFHHPVPVAEENEDQITFTGAAYPGIISKYPNHYRRISMDVLFKPLLENGYKIDFYGDNYHKQVIKSLYNFDVPDSWLHGRYPYEKTCSIYSSCGINLVTQNHEGTLTKRTFEILGSGGFALSYNNSVVKKFFNVGKDIVVSSSPNQTLEIVEYYKNHPDEYKTVRENALISVQNHTYKQRAEYIISKLKKTS